MVLTLLKGVKISKSKLLSHSDWAHILRGFQGQRPTFTCPNPPSFQDTQELRGLFNLFPKCVPWGEQGVFWKWVCLGNTGLKNIKQTCRLKCLPFVLGENLPKRNPVCHVCQSYLSIECCFHGTSILKNTLEKNCLSYSPLQLQMRSQMRHNLCWFLIKKWGKPQYLAWSATGPCPNRTFHLERQRTLYFECCRLGVATQLLKELQREAMGLGISSALWLWWQSIVIRILFSDISIYLVKWFKKVYMLFTNTIICT